MNMAYLLSELSANPWLHALGWTLLHFCWQGVLVAIMLRCVLGLLGEQQAGARYAACAAAMASLVALPVLTFARLGTDAWRLHPSGDVPIVSGLTIDVGAGAGSGWLGQVALLLDHAVPWLTAAWVAGAAFFVLRLSYGLVDARRLRTAAVSTPQPDLLVRFAALRLRAGVARVRLLESARVQVPTVVGWLRPVVLLPVSCLTGLPPDQMEAILLHELAHVQRHDYLVSVLQSVAEALLFYHPGVWWVSRQLRAERECCCDAFAVEHGGDRLAFARALSYLEERRAVLPEFVLGANGGALTMRIKRLLGTKEDASAPQFAALLLLAAVVMAAGGYIATAAHGQDAGYTSKAPEVSSGLMQGYLVTNVPPEYPPMALAAHIQGAVVLHVLIGKDGKVEKLAEISGPPMLVMAARDAVRQWKYRPFLVDGVPTEVQTMVTVNFGMGGEAPGHDTPANFNSKAPTVSPGTLQGQRVAPVYPYEARAAHLEGTVVLHALIGKDGTVKKLAVVSGAPVLSDAALKAVNQWKFQPYLVDGKASEVQTNIEVNFKLTQPPAPASTTQPDAQTQAAPVAPPPPPPPPTAAVPTQADGRTVRVSQGVIASSLVDQIEPVYPPDARAAHVQGAVVLHAVIGKDGMIGKLEVVSGAPMLWPAAVDAVKHWRYKPYLVNGEPTEVETTITVNFVLQEAPAAAPDARAMSAPEPQRMPDGAIAPVVLYKVAPEYTEEARTAKISGIVLVGLKVDTEGMPRNVQVLRGIDHGLDGKAVEAVKQYRFRPAMKDGQPVEEQLTIEVNFQMF